MQGNENKSEIKDEINLYEHLKKIYRSKRLIIKYSIISAFIGTVFALLQPNQYTSSTTFIPQLSSELKSGGSLSGLASLAGINLGGMEGSLEFPPSLYPQVVESVPFRLDLLSSKIQINDTEFSLREYFLEKKKSYNLIDTIKKYTVGLPALILEIFKSKIKTKSTSSLIYIVSEEDQKLFENLSDFLDLSINEKDGFITMSFTDHNNRVAAQIVKIAQTQLQDKIIEFKVKSSKELLDFTVEQYNEKKSNFEMLQDERAIFVDKNINISSSLFQNKLNRLESELSIAQNVVQQLATQVEQAKLQVNKDTPVFTTINPVSIPFNKSAPERGLIVLFFLILGFVSSCFYVLFKEHAIEILKSFKS